MSFPVGHCAYYEVSQEDEAPTACLWDDPANQKSLHASCSRHQKVHWYLVREGVFGALGRRRARLPGLTALSTVPFFRRRPFCLMSHGFYHHVPKESWAAFTVAFPVFNLAFQWQMITRCGMEFLQHVAWPLVHDIWSLTFTPARGSIDGQARVDGCEHIFSWGYAA